MGAITRTSRVLVVDDDPVSLAVLRALVEYRGYDAVTAIASPARALEMLQEHRFDILVTDYMMPGIKGRELIKRAKELYPIACILVTSYLGEIQIELRGDTVALLEKPPKMADFFAAMDKAQAEVDQVLSTRPA